MKKPLLLVIANESYFQSSFLDVFSKEIKTSDYFINDIYNYLEYPPKIRPYSD